MELNIFISKMWKKKEKKKKKIGVCATKHCNSYQTSSRFGLQKTLEARNEGNASLPQIYTGS